MTYSPPTAQAIADAQNLDQNLRLLLAQRRLYSRAKAWTMVRGTGIGIVAVSAPILAAVWPEAALAVATVAAAWFALNRLLFRGLLRFRTISCFQRILIVLVILHRSLDSLVVHI